MTIEEKIAAAERGETVSWTYADVEPLLRYILELRDRLAHEEA